MRISVYSALVWSGSEALGACGSGFVSGVQRGWGQGSVQEFFQSILEKPWFYWADFVHSGIVMVEYCGCWEKLGSLSFGEDKLYYVKPSQVRTL